VLLDLDLDLDLDLVKDVEVVGPPLWSSGQSFLLLIQSSRVRFSAL
jgi:hypothetical protein